MDVRNLRCAYKGCSRFAYFGSSNPLSPKLTSNSPPLSLSPNPLSPKRSSNPLSPKPDVASNNSYAYTYTLMPFGAGLGTCIRGRARAAGERKAAYASSLRPHTLVA